MEEIESGCGGGRMNLLDGAGEVLADDLALEGATLVEGEVFVVLLVHEQHREEQRDLVTGRAPPPLPFFRSKVCRCCLSPDVRHLLADAQSPPS
jgi:hypothetical protein